MELSREQAARHRVSYRGCARYQGGPETRDARFFTTRQEAASYAGELGNPFRAGALGEGWDEEVQAVLHGETPIDDETAVEIAAT